MLRINRRIQLGLALFMCLASARLLVASCTNDEYVHTVFRISSSGDWCNEYDYANCILIRAATKDGDKACEAGDTEQWQVTQCFDCHCTGTQAMRFCVDGGTEVAATRNEVTLWRCESANTDCNP